MFENVAKLKTSEVESRISKLCYIYSDSNASKIQFGSYLLLFSSESYITPFPTSNFSPKNLEYNFAYFLYGHENWSLTQRGRRRLICTLRRNNEIACGLGCDSL
jgi:hypothetical protein